MKYIYICIESLNLKNTRIIYHWFRIPKPNVYLIFITILKIIGILQYFKHVIRELVLRRLYQRRVTYSLALNLRKVPAENISDIQALWCVLGLTNWRKNLEVLAQNPELVLKRFLNENMHKHLLQLIPYIVLMTSFIDLLFYLHFHFKVRRVRILKFGSELS